MVKKAGFLFWETFAPTGSMAALRVLLSLSLSLLARSSAGGSWTSRELSSMLSWMRSSIFSYQGCTGWGKLYMV